MRGEAREEARVAAMIDENDEVKSKEGGGRGAALSGVGWPGQCNYRKLGKTYEVEHLENCDVMNSLV